MSWMAGYITHKERDELLALAKALSVITAGFVGIVEASFVESFTRKDDLGWSLVEPVNVNLLLKQLEMVNEVASSFSEQLKKALEGEPK